MSRLPRHIETERLLLKALTLADAEAHCAELQRSYALHAKWLAWVRPDWSLADSRDFCMRTEQKHAAEASVIMGLWVKNTSPSGSRLVGAMNIGDINWRIPSGELGYWGATTSQGQGYISEAARALCDVFFDQLAFKRIWLTCDANNRASCRVAERALFSCEGRLRHARRDLAGHLSDTIMYARYGNESVGSRTG